MNYFVSSSENRGQKTLAIADVSLFFHFPRRVRRCPYGSTMPELPEVESARVLCETHCLGATVTSVEFLEDGTFDEKIFNGSDAKSFRKALMGKTLLGTKRHGKHMWWDLGEKHDKGSKAKSHDTKSDMSPLFHFGMTGSMSIKGKDAMKYKSFKVDTESWPPRFAKLVVAWDNGASLAYTDPRRFGKIKLLKGCVTEQPPISQLGFDPLLNMPDFKAFAEKFLKRAAPIKAVLLDQKIAAGVGNWIADEILWLSKVHPETPAKDLSTATLGVIREKMAEIVKVACESNAESSLFPSDWLFHSRWGKVAGNMNGSKIEFITVGGRTTAFVPAVQRKDGIKKEVVKAEKTEAKKRSAEVEVKTPPKKAKKAPPAKVKAQVKAEKPTVKKTTRKLR
tara:strand:+ start:10800 stop:11981 length:1182 start_codon:yes stop_codon:yes gene_type:complete